MSQIWCNVHRDVFMRCTRITVDARLQIGAGFNATTCVLSTVIVEMGTHLRTADVRITHLRGAFETHFCPHATCAAKENPFNAP